MAKESERNVFQIYNWKEMVWWFMLSIPALGRQKQIKLCDFKAILVYMVRFYLKNKKKEGKQSF